MVRGGKPLPIRRLNLACAFLAVVAIAGTTAQGTAQTTMPPLPEPPPPSPAASDTRFVSADAAEVRWRDSYAAGTPQHGFLVRGIQLPPEGVDFFTWDFPLSRSPSRPWRRWGTDTTIATTLRVISEYRAANPNAPRVAIADISRQHGGPFGREFGGLGHASHQNGLDVDIPYPRKDRKEIAPLKPSQVDQRLAQDLVDRFVDAGAQFIFVGPHLNLRGPRSVVQKLIYHDNHMHVRFPRRPSSA